MFDRMLLVLDEPADRDRVVAALRPLARVEGAHVIVVLTVPFLETVAEMPHELSSDLAGDDEAADVFVDALVASLRSEGLPADGFTAVGRSALTLHAAAERVEASLIVLPTRPFRRLEELIHFARVPVIAVPLPTAPIQRILIPFDDQEESLEILPYAAALARAFRSEITLVPVGPAHREALEVQGLERVRREGVRADLLPIRGDPAAAVLALCRSLPAEAIAIGPGDHPWVPLLVRLSPVPVLLVRHAMKKPKRVIVEPPLVPDVSVPIVEIWKRRVPRNPVQGISEP
jgi:nucleotide-binding universal stress UspA family protein